MADEELRRLLRRTQDGGDPLAVTAVAQAYLRVGRADEAAWLLRAAAQRGEDVGPNLDALEPESLDRFELRVLGEAFARGKLTHAAFGRDGGRVFVAESERAILAWDLATGEVEELHPHPTFARGLVHDPRSDALAWSTDRPGLGGTGHVLDLASGELRVTVDLPTTPRRFALLEEHLLLLDGRAQALALDPQRPDWQLRNRADDGDSFSLVRYDRRKQRLLFHTPLVTEPRASVTPPFIPQAAYVAAGRAVVVSGERIGRVDEATGETSWTSSDEVAALPQGHRAASLSGRYLAAVPEAISERFPGLVLCDVTTGATRTFELPAKAGPPVWSPSGRRLVVPTNAGTLLLLDATGLEPALAPDAGWVELRRGDRFWLARRRGAAIHTRHGVLGERGVSRSTELPDAGAAAEELRRRVREKLADGYVERLLGAGTELRLASADGGAMEQREAAVREAKQDVWRARLRTLRPTAEPAAFRTERPGRICQMIRSPWTTELPPIEDEPVRRGAWPQDLGADPFARPMTDAISELMRVTRDSEQRPAGVSLSADGLRLRWVDGDRLLACDVNAGAPAPTPDVELRFDSPPPLWHPQADVASVALTTRSPHVDLEERSAVEVYALLDLGQERLLVLPAGATPVLWLDESALLVLRPDGVPSAGAVAVWRAEVWRPADVP